jgi:hypothetical protein
VEFFFLRINFLSNKKRRFLKKKKHGQCHFRNAAFSSQLEAMVDGALARASAFRVDLGVGRALITGGLLTLTLVSGFHLPQHNRGQYHFRSETFSSQLEVMIGDTLTRASACRLGCRWDYHRVWIVCSVIVFVDFSFVDLVFFFRCF